MKTEGWSDVELKRIITEAITNVFFDRCLSISGNKLVINWFLAKMLPGFYLIDDHLTTDGTPDHTKEAHVLLSITPCLLESCCYFGS